MEPKPTTPCEICGLSLWSSSNRSRSSLSCIGCQCLISDSTSSNSSSSLISSSSSSSSPRQSLMTHYYPRGKYKSSNRSFIIKIKKRSIKQKTIPNYFVRSKDIIKIDLLIESVLALTEEQILEDSSSQTGDTHSMIDAVNYFASSQ